MAAVSDSAGLVCCCMSFCIQLLTYLLIVKCLSLSVFFSLSLWVENSQFPTLFNETLKKKKTTKMVFPDFIYTLLKDRSQFLSYCCPKKEVDHQSLITPPTYSHLEIQIWSQITLHQTIPVFLAANHTCEI